MGIFSSMVFTGSTFLPRMPPTRPQTTKQVRSAGGMPAGGGDMGAGDGGVYGIDTKLGQGRAEEGEDGILRGGLGTGEHTHQVQGRRARPA